MQEHAEYKVYAINRGYEQQNDMNAHVIVLIEFAMSYCGYIPLQSIMLVIRYYLWNHTPKSLDCRHVA